MKAISWLKSLMMTAVVDAYEMLQIREFYKITLREPYIDE